MKKTKIFLTILLSSLLVGLVVNGATILLTNSTDTMSIFKTNYNTSVTNLNNGTVQTIAGITSSTINFLASGVGLSVGTSSNNITYTWTNPGYLTSFSTTTINGVSGPIFTFNILGTNGLSYSTSTGIVSLTQATSTSGQSGFLSSADWTTFNNKQPLVTLNGTTGQIIVASTSPTWTFSLATTTVTAASYTNTNLTVDAYGRITSAANGTAGGGGGLATSTPFTAGYIPYATSSNSITNSQIYQSNGNIGIGTTTPATAFVVNGTSTFAGNIIQSGPIITGTSTVSIGQSGNQGCIEMRDSDDGNWSNIITKNGIMYINTGQCQ